MNGYADPLSKCFCLFELCRTIAPMSDRLVKLAAYTTAPEAHIVRGRLESEGIAAVVADEHMVGANWFYSQAIGGVRVLVPESELKRAKEILQIPVELDQAESEAAWGTCPKCSSAEVIYRKDSKVTVLTWLLLGIPLLLPRKQLRCQKCLHRWGLPAK